MCQLMFAWLNFTNKCTIYYHKFSSVTVSQFQTDTGQREILHLLLQQQLLNRKSGFLIVWAKPVTLAMLLYSVLVFFNSGNKYAYTFHLQHLLYPVSVCLFSVITQVNSKSGKMVLNVGQQNNKKMYTKFHSFTGQPC